jgi:hypothetical protein
MAIPRNLANLANQLNADGDVPKIEVNDSKVEVTDTGSNGTIVFNTDGSERMRVTNAGDVGIGTSSPAGRLGVLRNSAAAGLAGVVNNPQFAISNDQNFGYPTGMLFRAPLANFGGALNNAAIWAEYEGANIAYLGFATYGGGALTERARITSGGDFLVGTVEAISATKGARLYSTGEAVIVRDNATPMLINRITSDGDLIQFRQDNTTEGTISVSGNTVSYNAFTGGHWTQLQEGRGYNPDIPRGTVMSSIGEMAVWKSVEWTETVEHPATEEKEAWTESIPHRESYLGNLDIGATFEEDGFTKTVVDDGNERLPKVKISDVVGDKAVYGVFQTWDEVEDMLITSLGAFVVRIAAGVTVQIGDLLESNGDGCAKVQDDDIIRSKTIGKVTSTVATATYDDGSYTVPCVIYCG